MAITTLATVRQSVPRLASVADAEVNRLIDESTSIIEGYTRRQFGQATFTQTISTTGSGQFFLKQRPIASITSITVGLPDNPRVLDASSYRFDPLSGEVRGAGSGEWFPSDLWWADFWPCGGGFQSVRVVYVAGDPVVPAAVVGRCLALVSRCASGLAMDASVKSKTMGKVSYTLDVLAVGALTAGDREILCRYRNWDLGDD